MRERSDLLLEPITVKIDLLEATGLARAFIEQVSLPILELAQLSLEPSQGISLRPIHVSLLNQVAYN